MIEIDRMKRKRGAIREAAKRNRSPNRFDQFIKNVEQDRDYWKAEVETLQQILKLVMFLSPPVQVHVLSHHTHPCQRFEPLNVLFHPYSELTCRSLQV